MRHLLHLVKPDFDMKPDVFSLWLWVVGIGAALAFIYWVMWGRKRTCAHDFEEIDAVANMREYRCRRCGIRKYE